MVAFSDIGARHYFGQADLISSCLNYYYLRTTSLPLSIVRALWKMRKSSHWLIPAILQANSESDVDFFRNNLFLEYLTFSLGYFAKCLKF